MGLQNNTIKELGLWCKQTLSMVTVLGVLLATSAYAFVPSRVDAGSLSGMYAVSNSNKVSAAKGKGVAFTLTTAIAAASSSTVAIAYPFTYTSSNTAFSNATVTDYDITTSSSVTTFLSSGTGNDVSLVAYGSCTSSGATKFEISSINTSTSNGIIFTFTHCNGTAGVAASTFMSVAIGDTATSGGTGTHNLTNPSTSGNQTITIAAPDQTDTGSVLEYISDALTTSATVAETFTLTITPTNTKPAGAESTTPISVVAGAGTSVATSGTVATTSINFGSLTASTAVLAVQMLSVVTNAANGYAVFVSSDGNMLTPSAADIDSFAGPSNANTWSSPACTLGSEATYGWMGVTSSDPDAGYGSDLFSSGTKYAGVATSTTYGIQTRVLGYTGAANGTSNAVGVGWAKVGYKLEVCGYQESGVYSNIMFYNTLAAF